MIKKYFLLAYLCFLMTTTAFAEISGTVSDSQKTPVQGATVVLLQLPDSTYLEGTVTDGEGKFILTDATSAAKRLLRVQAFGYEPANVPVDSNKIEVVLSLSSTELGEIIVRGKAPSMTREGGKFIFIPNDLADDVANARNLMKLVPLVNWADYTVSILGKNGCKIYLNGKDPHWETIEVSSMLHTLDPHSIKRIEIITDPGASQSASFAGGIINIIYDDPTQGFRGVAIANTSISNDNPSTWPNLWLNYQKNKFKASLNLGGTYNHSYSHQTNTYDYITLGQQVINDTKTTSFSNSLSGKLNLSYDLTQNSVLGASVVLGTSRSHAKSVVNTQTIDENRENSSFMRQTQDTHPDKPFVRAAVYYTLNTDNKGSMLDILAGYGTTASHTDVNNNFSGLKVPQKFENDQYAFSGKADYTQIFNRTTRLLAGVAVSDYHLEYTETMPEVYDRFKYNDRQVHAYAQLNKRWSNSLSTDIGLRVENTHTNGHQTQDNISDTQNYTDLFTSLSVSYSIPQGNQGISLNYEKNIMRPDYSMLNPYKRWSSDNTYSQGNPYLKPEYLHTVGLSYSFLNKFVFRTRYTYAYQLATSYTLATPEGLTISSYTNSGRRNMVSLNFDYNTSFGSFYRFGANASANYQNIKTGAEGQKLHSSRWDWSLSQDNMFIFSRKHFFTGQLRHNLYSPMNYGTYKEDWRYVIFIGLQKSFNFGLDTGLTVGIPVTGYKHSRHLNLSDYAYSFYSHDHLYNIQLNISYSFGKTQVSGARDRSDDLK